LTSLRASKCTFFWDVGQRLEQDLHFYWPSFASFSSFKYGLVIMSPTGCIEFKCLNWIAKDMDYILNHDDHFGAGTAACENARWPPVSHPIL